ncbi:MAG: DNA-methyltransferase [Eubacteriales bacterium]
MFEEVINGEKRFEFGIGDSIELLKQIPDNCIDCAITSPPYWQQRIYEDYDGALEGIIGSENTPEEYVEHLMIVIREVQRVLKPEGTFWLNLGDKFIDKCLMGMPWRVALAMEKEGWVLRSDIIWDQMKGTQSCTDRFRDMYEHVFQFAKSKKYYFDAEPVRIIPQVDAHEQDGKMISATGVSGKKYFKQIRESTVLTKEERENALTALNETLEEMRRGEVVDFRMTIRGEQRSYHSENTKVSGRAKELADKGYYIMKMRKKGFLPPDIWRIVPEDKWRKDTHCAVFPEELLRIPILSTCPKGGIVLDPFSGTGSTVDAAVKLGRKSIGLDLSKQYTEVAKARVEETLSNMGLFAIMDY